VSFAADPGGRSELIVKLQKTAKSISKMSRRIALRHSDFFASARNPFMAV
jgi:hypothetical protein